jgi:hypothetical protein
MSLDILLEPIPERNMTQPCKVGRIVESLTDPHKTALINLLKVEPADGGMTAEDLQIRLQEAGLEVGATAIRRHRKQRCNCEQSA